MSRRTLLTAGLVLAGASLAVTVAVVVVTRTMNGFRAAEVVPGVLRANQPRPADLAAAVKRYGVRAVFSLRGHRRGEAWHVAEVAACRDLGIAHEDVRVKNDDWVAQHEARRFVLLLEAAPRPVLIHCKNGVDRSGWAAAVASLLAGSPLAQGLAELSPAKGHVCNPLRCPLHRFFALYRDHLEEHALAHDAGRFRSWIMESYCPEPYDAEVEVLRAPTVTPVRPAQPLSFTVRVRNRSHEGWRTSSGSHGVRLGGRVLGSLDLQGREPLSVFRTPNNPARDVARAGMEDGTIAAGAERVFELAFPAPDTPGRYVLQIDMVDEHVHWFSDLGGPGVLVAFEVVGA